MYKTLILPLFDYGDIAFHGITGREADTLQKLQNVACRSILRVDSRTHIADIHDDLKLPTLYQRRNQHIASSMHNFVNGNGPPYCNKFVSKVSERHDFNTRSGESELLVVPKTKLRITERSLAVMGPRTWNQIPGHIHAIDLHETFKKEVKEVNFT